MKNSIHQLTIPFTPDLAKISQHLRLDHPSDEIYSIVDDLEKMNGFTSLYARTAIESSDVFQIMVEGHPFSSAIKGYLENKQFYPYIITGGSDFDKYYPAEDNMLLRYYCDEIKVLALMEAGDSLREAIRREFQEINLNTINPGTTRGWPLDDQKSLFDLLGNPAESLGVTLTENFMMVPTKTMSGIFYPSEKPVSNCSLCDMHTCGHRKET